MGYNILMNIYFTASTVGKEYYSKNYERVIDSIRKRGHKVRYKHMDDAAEAMRRARSKSDRFNYQKMLEQWIASSDCMIVEGTYPSMSVGYEISIALRLGKPILLLYHQGVPPSLFDDSTIEKMIIEKYDAKNLQEILDDFFGFAQSNSESRFTFFITAEIASYLDKIARDKKTPKSVYLRQLIERDMKK